MEDKISIAIIIVVAIALVLSIAFFAFGTGTLSRENKAYETKTSEGEASISLTPSLQDSRLTVDISVDTHSVDLSAYDLRELATLNYGGISVKPASAPLLSGHHVTGVLVFDAGEMPGSFEIVIKGIPDIDERKFSWD